jgi:D-alanyl-D-alanine carboxypeptidase
VLLRTLLHFTAIYRTIYVCIADQDLMITAQTNTQPPEGTDRLGDAINALYDILKRSKADSVVIVQ